MREAANAARKAFTGLLNAEGVKVVLPDLLAALDTKKNWQTKNAALACFGELTKRCPNQVSKCLPDIIPGESSACVISLLCCLFLFTCMSWLGPLLCCLQNFAFLIGVQRARGSAVGAKLGAS